MNKQRRKEIQRIIDGLISWQDAIEEVLSEEQDYMDNMPENLQSSEKAETAQNAIYCLEEASSNLEELLDNLNGALE